MADSDSRAGNRYSNAEVLAFVEKVHAPHDAGLAAAYASPVRDEMPAKQGPFDAVFVDADKESYDVYGRWAAKHLRTGGLLLGDNAYYFGKLTENSAPAAAMRRFHEEAAQTFDTVCIPTPDGLLLGIKR